MVQDRAIHTMADQ